MQKTYSGNIIKGDGRGKTIGYPTANIDISSIEIDVQPGVYSAKAKLKTEEKWHQAILFFGPKKTFDQIENTLEVHILDFDQEIYNQALEFTIEDFVRGPIKFNSVEELVGQIKTDISQVRNIK
jgi:riboflavin kinase/FMN adenylyltransferase